MNDNIKDEKTPDDTNQEQTKIKNYRSQNPIIRLISSSKAIVVLGVTIACFTALFANKAQFHDITEFLKYIIGPWLVAQGLEDAFKKNLKNNV